MFQIEEEYAKLMFYSLHFGNKNNKIITPIVNTNYNYTFKKENNFNLVLSN